MLHFKNKLYPKITLLCRKYCQNAEGEFTESIKEHGEVWASIKPISGLTKISPDGWHNKEGRKYSQSYKIVCEKLLTAMLDMHT